MENLLNSNAFINILLIFFYGFIFGLGTGTAREVLDKIFQVKK